MGRRRLRLRPSRGVRQGPGRRRRGPGGLGREHPRSARRRRRRLHLRQGHPRRQPPHPGRQPGTFRAPLAPRGLLHAARHRHRPPALGRPARDGAAEPGRPLHPEPDPRGREARGRGGLRGGGLRGRARVAVAGAPQAAARSWRRPATTPGGGERGRRRRFPSRPRSRPSGPWPAAWSSRRWGAPVPWPTPPGAGLPGGVGSLRLQGRLVDGVRWSLGGLVAENEGRAWRTAAEFVLEPGGGHEVEVGAGYGAGDMRTDSRRCRAGAQPRGGGGVRPGPLAARRAADRDHRRPLHLHRLPARLAPRRRGGADRAARGPADPRARLGRHAHPDPGRRPADAVDGGGLAGHHVGAARRGPAPGALAALRGGRRPRARRRPHRGAGLRRDDARPAAHDLRRPHAVRPQRRKRSGHGASA